MQLRFAKPRASAAIPAAVVAICLIVLGALAVRARLAAPEHPPAWRRSSDGSRTVYVDFHPRHTREGWHGEPPVAFFKPVDRKPSIALTFDCGWVEEANGMKILDFLKARSLRATFFISGPFVFHDYRKGAAGGLNQANLRMIRRMIEDGHEFGSHSQTHPHNSVWIDWERENDELRRAWEAATREAFGETPPGNARMLPFWRAPFGEYDDRSLRMASRAGFPLHVGWTVDVHDGLGLPRCGDAASHVRCIDAKRMTDRVVDHVDSTGARFEGLVVLAHLQNAYDWTGTPDGLARLVDVLSERGVALRPLSAIFNWDLAPDVRRLSPASAP
ncbi:MAG: polysaccharide deacetylase family protein [Gemmatimonadota bacterium]|nr:polysaccharide deacetylase family protein [Gemmatimonadota bacterium]